MTYKAILRGNRLLFSMDVGSLGEPRSFQPAHVFHLAARRAGGSARIAADRSAGDLLELAVGNADFSITLRGLSRASEGVD